MTQCFGNDIRNGTDKLKFSINNIDSIPVLGILYIILMRYNKIICNGVKYIVLKPVF